MAATAREIEAMVREPFDHQAWLLIQALQARDTDLDPLGDHVADDLRRVGDDEADLQARMRP